EEVLERKRGREREREARRERRYRASSPPPPIPPPSTLQTLPGTYQTPCRFPPPILGTNYLKIEWNNFCSRRINTNSSRRKRKEDEEAWGTGSCCCGSRTGSTMSWASARAPPRSSSWPSRGGLPRGARDRRLCWPALRTSRFRPTLRLGRSLRS
ncbi:unnamed protein product, partial [Laminaria digitata]